MSTSTNNAGYEAPTISKPGQVIGISLDCVDTTPGGAVDRTYEYSGDGCSVIDLVRATITKGGACLPSDGFDDNGAARATFSSPVMSRRHARISINDDGTVNVTDLHSLHGTYVDETKLEPNVPFNIDSGNTIVLGKPIYRDNKVWKPASMRVTIKRVPPSDINKVSSPQPDLHVDTTPVVGESENEEDNLRDTPNRYGVHMYSPSYGSSEETDSEDMDTSSDSQSSDDSDSQEDACGSTDLEIESPTPESSPLSPTAPTMANKFCSILPFNVHLPTPPSRFPLPSLRDLGIFNSSASRVSDEGTSNEAPARLAPPSQPSTARETDEESSERRQEPFMASLPPPLSNHMTLLPMGPSGTGAMANNFYHMNAGHTMLPSDGNAGIFFSGDSYSQFIPSFPQNQLGAMDFVSDMHEFGMNELPLPGGLGGSEMMAGSSLEYGSTGGSAVEIIPNVQHDQSSASSPMQISSGRPSPDPEDDESSSHTQDKVEAETASSDSNMEEEVVVDDNTLPRSSLFLPPKDPNSTHTRMSSPEVTEISREKYFAEVQSKKEKSIGLACAAEPKEDNQLEERSDDLHRQIMNGGLSLHTASLVAQRLARIKETLQGYRDKSATLDSPTQRPIIRLPTSHSYEADKGRDVDVFPRAQTFSSGESSQRAASASVRSESAFSSLPARIQALVASELTGVASRITDLKESIGGLRPVFERQIALAIAATRSSAESNRAPVETSPVPSTEINSEADAKKDLQDIREEMLRFSSIMEQVLAKIEPLRAQADQAIQADYVEPEETHTKSRKRKHRDLEGDESSVLDCTSEDEAERPAKRSRTPSGSITRSVATAAGYTSLGAVLTFVTFAYLL